MMRKPVLWVMCLFTTAAFAGDSSNPIDRWMNAVGGREKLASIKAVYREATLQWNGFEGELKAWHTCEGKYRKEEHAAIYGSTECFDGTTGFVKQGPGEARPMTPPEIQRAHSSAYANWNAAFFAFFPERRHGTVTVDPDGTIVLHPEGGIDWRITLDPATSLPKTMVHQEGDRTVTVTFVSYETVDGVKFEKEIQRSAGDPAKGAIIKFTKTVINPDVDPAMFSPR